MTTPEGDTASTPEQVVEIVVSQVHPEVSESDAARLRAEGAQVLLGEQAAARERTETGARISGLEAEIKRLEGLIALPGVMKDRREEPAQGDPTDHHTAGDLPTSKLVGRIDQYETRRKAVPAASPSGRRPSMTSPKKK